MPPAAIFLSWHQTIVTIVMVLFWPMTNTIPTNSLNNSGNSSPVTNLIPPEKVLDSTTTDRETFGPSSDIGEATPQMDTVSDVEEEEMAGSGNLGQQPQYHWERVHSPGDCPLNCSAPLLCWRLAGYLIPFICLPAQLDPNEPLPLKNSEEKRKDLVRWLLALSNTEIAILALLLLNSWLGMCNCLCVCVARKCRPSKRGRSV